MEHKAAPVKAKTIAQPAAMQLPLTVVSLMDIGRLQRELEAVEIFVAQAEARKTGQSVALPRLTHNLDTLAHVNQRNLLVKAEREEVKKFLDEVRAHAPRVHISFAADPSSAFLQKVVSWFRTTVHPLVILQVGLQPTLAAGCLIRTNNKFFDLSLRKDFENKRTVLMDKIREIRTAPEKQPAPPVPLPPGQTPADLREFTFTPPQAEPQAETSPVSVAPPVAPTPVVAASPATSTERTVDLHQEANHG